MPDEKTSPNDVSSILDDVFDRSQPPTETPTDAPPQKRKAITPNQLRTRKLAETAVSVAINSDGRLATIADQLPDQFPTKDKVVNIASHVHNRLKTSKVQREITNIVEAFDLSELAQLTKRKLRAIVDNTKEERPSAPQAALMTVALKLSGELVEKQEVKQTQGVDLSGVKQMSREEKSALLMELIRLESAGVEVTAKPEAVTAT